MPTKVKTKKYEIVKGNEPLMVAMGSTDTTTSTRRNRAGTIERTNKFTNIEQGVMPYSYSISGSGKEMDARHAIVLCQKAYFNIAIVRNIVELMTEFSVGHIYFEDGNQSSRSFFKAWWNKIGGYSFLDRYFREHYRSGNNFIMRVDNTLQAKDVKEIVQAFGFKSSKAAIGEARIPVKYIILNPADILFAGNITFNFGTYYKRLSDYELMRLRYPKTDEDREMLNNLPANVRQQINQKNVAVVNLPLDPNYVSAIFYKKQDYEPFAAPMVYPILEDLDFKIELKRLDMAIARTQQQVILLVTTGAPPDDGGINPENIRIFQKLLENESVGRVLVADYTTKASFVVPPISDILTAKKYEQLDNDINLGLNNILVSGEKFANQDAKVKVFLARLNLGREIFLREFLIPEIRRISDELGFKSYPTPYFEEISLSNNDVRDRIYVQMAQLGLLTPDEVVTALDSGRLPDVETSMMDQEAYKEAKDKGLYQPIAPPPAPGAGGAPTGRPAGSPSPQLTKHVTPIGGSDTTYSTKRLVDNFKIATSLQKEVEVSLRAKFNKKQLTQAQKDIAFEITKTIIANEGIENWIPSIQGYCDKPIDKNHDRVKAIMDIAAEHETDVYMASLLYISKNE